MTSEMNCLASGGGCQHTSGTLTNTSQTPTIDTGINDVDLFYSYVKISNTWEVWNIYRKDETNKIFVVRTDTTTTPYYSNLITVSGSNVTINTTTSATGLTIVWEAFKWS